MADTQRTCAATVAQSGKPCTRKAVEGSLVCKVHSGMSNAQKAAQKANLKRGKELKALQRAANADHPTANERWALLLSGQITVRDLDDAEVKKMRVRGKGGGFDGRPRALPSHIAQAFAAEQQRRLKDKVRKAVPEALEALVDIMRDPEHKDRKAVAQWFLERELGKTPDVIRVEESNTFERLSEEVLVDRGLADEASAFLAREGAGAPDEA
jgi:hypothetical protein